MPFVCISYINVFQFFFLNKSLSRESNKNDSLIVLKIKKKFLHDFVTLFHILRRECTWSVWESKALTAGRIKSMVSNHRLKFESCALEEFHLLHLHLLSVE